MSSMDSPTPKRSFMEQLRHVIHEGNVRHAVVEAKDGHRYVDLPLSLVILGGLVAPWLAAVGVVIAVVAGCAMRVERHGQGPGEAPLPETDGDAPGEEAP